ncbi:MAG: hypothetical protein R3194_07530 [Limnobacter sp.]|nr:hypothetical protein [Limnobacter sp.]
MQFITRKHLILITAWVACLSLLYPLWYGLSYFNLDSGTAMKVASLASNGGDENFSMLWGVLLFSLLALVHWIRRKRPYSAIDACAGLGVLGVQLALLGLVEEASFTVSLLADGGWLLALWFIGLGLITILSLGLLVKAKV